MTTAWQQVTIVASPPIGLKVLQLEPLAFHAFEDRGAIVGMWCPFAYDLPEPLRLSEVLGKIDTTSKVA